MTDLLDPIKISELLCVKKEYFRDHISKRPDFPKPCLVLNQKLKRWRACDIQDFIDKKQAEMAR